MTDTDLVGVQLQSVGLLGTLHADVGGARVDLGGRQRRAVLARLLVARGEVVSVDRIIEDLWRGEAPPKAMAGLQVHVSRLRSVLEPERGARAKAQVLVSAAPGYAVRLPGEAVDAWRFEQLVRVADHEPEPARQLQVLEDALALWQGAALAEFEAEEWAQPEAARLEELRLYARERLVDAALRAGANNAAVPAGEALVRDAPLREEAWRLLALAQYASARQAEALATLRRARQTLTEELGIDPGPALQELERDILAQQVQLPAPTHTAPVHAQASTPQRATEVPRPVSVAEFVGRHAELERLIAAAGRVAIGRAGVAIVSGEPGAGKSALLRQVTDQLSADGWLVAVGRCPEIEGAPPAWAWAEALRSLAEHAPVGEFAEALAPLLRDDARPVGGDADAARFRLHQAAASWLSSLHPRPVLMVLDDVHLADVATLKMLTQLLGTPNRTRLCFLLAYRPERSSQLTDLLAAVAPLEPERVSLVGLDATAARQLIITISGEAPTPAVVATLLERTGGNPFYLRESARLLASVGAEAALHTVPSGVTDVLLRRVDRLPATAQTVLRLAAVAGRSVDVDVLSAIAASAAHLAEFEVYDALEAAEIAGFLTTTDPGTVRFTHVLTRDALYADLPAVRRRTAHAAATTAIAELTPADVAALAHHSTRGATAATAATAASYCMSAAEQAEARYAYDTAVQLYRQALSNLDHAAHAEPRQRLDVLMRLVPAMVRTGVTSAMHQTRREAVNLARQLGDEHLLAQAITCWNVPAPWVKSNYDPADTEFITLITRTLTASTLTDRERCMLLNTYARELLYNEQTPDLSDEDAAKQALELARRIGDPELIALSLMGLAECYPPDLCPNERDAVNAELRQVAEDHGLLSFELAADIFEAVRACTRGVPDTYRRRIDHAITLSAKLGLAQGYLSASHLEAGFALVTGDVEHAECEYRQCAEYFRREGVESADDYLTTALLAIRQAQGRLAEMLDTIQARYDNTPQDAPSARLWVPTLALCLADAGRVDDARVILAAMPEPPRKITWTTMNAALAAIAVGDRDLAAAIYPGLLPFHDQIAGASLGIPYGLVPHVLGRIDLSVGRLKEAGEHLTTALDIAQRCHNDAWITNVRADLDRCR